MRKRWMFLLGNCWGRVSEGIVEDNSAAESDLAISISTYTTRPKDGELKQYPALVGILRSAYR